MCTPYAYEVRFNLVEKIEMVIDSSSVDDVLNFRKIEIVLLKTVKFFLICLWSKVLSSNQNRCPWAETGGTLLCYLTQRLRRMSEFLRRDARARHRN